VSENGHASVAGDTFIFRYMLYRQTADVSYVAYVGVGGCDYVKYTGRMRRSCDLIVMRGVVCTARVCSSEPVGADLRRSGVRSLEVSNLGGCDCVAPIVTRGNDEAMEIG
jgi:hypothetical protein